MGIRRDDITGEDRVQIALSVLSPDRTHGTVTHLANFWELSRSSIYTMTDKFRNKLFQLLEPGRHGPDSKRNVEVDRNRIVRAVAVLTLAGVSQRAVLDCLKEILDTSVSLGWVNGRIAELENAAADWNRQQTPDIGESLSGDELFANGAPNLLVVGNDSLYIYELSRQPNCDGEAWAEILKRMPGCPQFASDAGKGIEAGVKSAGLKIHQLDWDHLLRPFWGQHARLEKQAYAALEAVELREKLFENANTEARLQKHLEKWEKLYKEAEEKVERLDAFERLARQVDDCFALIDVQTGLLPDSLSCVERLHQVGQQLAQWSGRIYKKLSSNLLNWAKNLFNYQPVLQQTLSPLISQYGQDAVAALCAIWQIEADDKRHTQSLAQRFNQQMLWEKHWDTATSCLEENRLWKAWGTICETLRHSWRGSMLAECINSLLRPKLDSRQHTDQGCLELFRFSHNNYPFKRGKRAGHSPAQLAGIGTVDDPLVLLGLEAKVSI